VSEEIRVERPEDLNAIRHVNDQAFGQDLEGRIVNAIRASDTTLLSLVATIDGRVVGHILYSPASIGNIRGAALGPMAVLPEVQRQGIGSRLVEAGNQAVLSQGLPFIVVLGHVGFYPRFGFVPASSFGITCEWDVPDDAFMVLTSNLERMRGISGQAKYRPEFSLG